MMNQEENVMSEVQAPVAEQAAPQKPKRSNEQKKRTKTIIKRLIAIVLVLAILAGAGFAVWYFVFREKEDEGATGEPIFDTARIGSITSMVNGYGTANAKSSASITLTQDGVVDQLFVTQGQMVYEGDPLYVVTSPKAEQALEDAKEALVKSQESYQACLTRLSELQKELVRLQETRKDLTVTAPHPGKLMDVANITVGQQLSPGASVATIVDDTRLKLSLYYSYAYENDIHVGDSATVSVPVLMRDLPATVETINKVRMITPEGGVNFEVVLVVENPGTMTEGMKATAAMTDASGNPIYPYADGSFTYYQTTAITIKEEGPVKELVDLINYAEVTEGQTLVVQGSETLDEKIRNQQKTIEEYQEETMAAQQADIDAKTKAVEEAEKGLANFSAVAPITGMVVAMNLSEGLEVTAGSTAITISDNSVMTVNIQVDDRNRQYIDVGMELQLNDWYGNSYIGVVDSLAVIGENRNGVTVYPGVVRVDNPTGSLMGGYGLDFSFVASQSEGCIVIPSGDVRYYSPEGAEEPQPVVYVKTDEERENMVDKSLLPADMQAEIPKGCIVLEIELGLNDDSNVEVKSGLNDGDLVYNNTPKTDGNYYG